MKGKLLYAFVLATIASCPAAAAAEFRLDFSTPAEATGEVTVQEGRWALLIFDEHSTAEANIQLKGVASGMNYSRVAADAYTTYGEIDHQVELQPKPFDVQENAQMVVNYRRAWSSLLVEADNVILTARKATFSIVPSMGDKEESLYLPAQYFPYDSARDDGANAATGVVVSLKPPNVQNLIQFELSVTGIRRLEWHNVTVLCDAGNCPDSARTNVTQTMFPGGWTKTTQFSFIELVARGGSLNANGTNFLAAVGDERINLRLDGQARFPEAFLTGKCEDPCSNPGGKTFLAQGEIKLHKLGQSPTQSKRLTTDFDAKLSSAAIDESSVATFVQRTTVGTATVIGAVFIFKLIVSLFARNTRPLLDHPKAKAIHDLVHRRPGLSFGQIRGEVGWGHGTVHYHLQRLLKAGLIVGYEYRTSTRYYENHGRHKHDWGEYAALHKPELRELHAWIAEHPHSSQSQIIAATAKQWGWKRSTTQHYLRALLEARLVRDHRTPVVVEYVAIRPAA